MKEKQTPLMRQYNQIKAKYPDTVLLFRMGDFFETFGVDAEITARVCGIVLTKRNNGGASEMPLAGFPHHQLDSYLPKLVRGGYRVAVCEQLEDPKFARGIVKRGVIEVVTPGVALNEKLLESKKNNYALAVSLRREKNLVQCGVSFIDASTGEFYATEIRYENLANLLEMLAPAEILISKSDKSEFQAVLDKLSMKPSMTKLEPWVFDEEFGRQALLGHFRTQNLKGFGIDTFTDGIAAAGAILHYLNETQQNRLSHIRKIQVFNHSDYMFLDRSTRRNLEITDSLNESGSEGTLISILDKTSTPMGGRMLRKWITRPLLKIESINKRLEIVRSIYNANDSRTRLRHELSRIADLERLASKICTSRANPRDLVMLCQSLNQIEIIRGILTEFDSERLRGLAYNLATPTEVTTLISNAIIEEPSIQYGTGNIFKHNHSIELDSYIEAKTSGKSWISNYQDKERSQSGISSLKVSFNNIFGYFIEITNSHKDKVPANYERKATLTNAERYITPELKEIETKILNAEERIQQIEQTLFADLLSQVAAFTDAFQDLALRIASLDCLTNYAELSRLYGYVEPVIDDSDLLEIDKGRHPVVERLMPVGERFTPNSTNLNPDGELIHIITGPNMSGKSCYLRQVGLVVLLAQIGCYVPATSARIGLVDRIFTRVGAQDNITSGESTFLVEMQEAANIMNNASNRSLILLDEVGRGTATFDGISIAWAIAEYIHNEIGAKTLFATHYHELNELHARYDNIANYRVEVLETGDSIIFTHNVRSGGSDHSFGIHVAHLAGMPDVVIERAESIMKTFENGSESDNAMVNTSKATAPKEKVKELRATRRKELPGQLSIFEFHDDKFRERILDLDMENVTPIRAFQILSELYLDLKQSQS